MQNQHEPEAFPEMKREKCQVFEPAAVLAVIFPNPEDQPEGYAKEEDETAGLEANNREDFPKTCLYFPLKRSNKSFHDIRQQYQNSLATEQNRPVEKIASCNSKYILLILVWYKIIIKYHQNNLLRTGVTLRR